MPSQLLATNVALQVGWLKHPTIQIKTHLPTVRWGLAYPADSYPGLHLVTLHMPLHLAQPCDCPFRCKALHTDV